MKKFKKLILLWPLMLCAVAARAQGSLAVDAPSVVTDAEIFKVVYTALGKTDDFRGPDFANFQVLAGPSQSTMSSTQIINGKMTQSYQVSFTYMLQATSVGKFTIAPATATVDKKACSSKGITIEVVKDNGSSAGAGAGAGSGSGQSGNQSSAQKPSASGSASGVGDIQLRLSLNKTSVVKGEPIIATLKLYSRAAISGFEDVKFPKFEGFWNQEIETPQNVEFHRENLNGTIYDAALLRKWMLLPQQTGEITIDPAEILCAIQVRHASSGHSVFDDFFDSYETVRKRASTPAIKVKVKPLPAGAPASFAVGVGEFKMDVKVTPDSVNSHEAASMIITISGTGNINLIDAPKVSFPSDFEVYDVKKTDNVSTSAGGNTGTRTFEYPFIPRSHGQFTIPSVDFSYYSVKNGKYVTVSSGARPFNVGRGSASDATVISSGSDKQSVRILGEDIRFIKTAVPRLTTGNVMLVASPVMYVILAVALVLFFVLSVTLKKYMRFKSDVARVRNRKANSVARGRLKKAGAYLKQNLYSAFYEELHKAIEGYVSDKFRLPMTDLNRDDIQAALEKAGRSEELIQRLLALLDACDYARYAPSTGSEAMEKHYDEAIDVLSSIEKQ